MKKIIIYCTLGTIFLLSGCNQSIKPKLCINTTCFNIEIADTEAKREYGLMNRTSIPKKYGMLFVFDREEQYTFWMKNTLIPLDMIRIDSGMNIVGIEEAGPCRIDPCPRYNPGIPASYVLEINKGISKEMGFNTGQKVEIKK